MKHMKKRMMAALLTAAMVICTFANVAPASAATLSAKQYLSKMEKASAKVKSYESTATTIVKASTEGQDMTSKSVVKQVMFADPLKAKSVTNTTVTSEGTETKSKIVTYMKQNSKGKIYAYTSTDGSDYVKMDMTGLVDDLTGLDVSGYSGAKIVKKSVKVNKVDTVQISAKIKGADMASVLDSMGLSSEDSDVTVDYSTLKPINVTLWIDKKTYHPVKLQTEMKDFLNSYMTVLYQMMGVDDMSIDYSKVSSTTTYAKYDNASKFTIPKACK